MGSGSSRLSASTVACTNPASSPRLPSAFRDLAKSVEEGLPLLEHLGQLPDYITGNRLWCLLQQHVKSIRIICMVPAITVLLLLLNDNSRLVIKALAQDRLERGANQLAAEFKVAASMPCHPLMATVTGACEEDGVGMCLVSPYAGISFNGLVYHPDWTKKLTPEERTSVYAEMAACAMTVHAELQGQGREGFIYRDTKFDNTTFDHVSGQIKVIDYGLATLVDKFDFHEGFTPGWFTPEMVTPEDNFHRFWTPAGQFHATNTTTDVFLSGKAGLEMICGLPEELQPPCPYDRDNKEAVETMLWAHYKAPYTRLIKRVRSRQARSFLQQVMAVDPRDRPSPLAALQHPFLAARAAEVHAGVGQTLPEYTQQVCRILDLLAPLQGQPGVFLATHHQEQWQYMQAAMTTAEAAAAPAAIDCPQDSMQVQQEDVSNSIDNEDDVATATPTASSAVVSDTSSLTCCVSAETSSSFNAADSATPLDATTAKHWLNSGLLKAFKRLKSFNSRTSSPKQGSCSKLTRVSSDTAAASFRDVGADAVVVIEPIGVSVPGFCGFRLFGGKSKAEASGKKASVVGAGA